MFYIGICDDEKETCAELENMLCRFGETHGIKIDISVWYTGEALCNFLKRENILDLLFLDIELVSTDGIKVGSFIREELEDVETAIVYISSKSSYAMNLFRIQPLDFLIKPLSQKSIEDVMERSIKLYERKNQLFEYSTKGYHFKIPYKEIIYFYSQNKKINIVLKEKEVQFNGKLKDIASSVPHNFILIHQSYLVNLDFIVECSYEIMKMQNGALLNISQPYRKTVREQIMQNEWERMK
ncbi:MAG: LytTR family DNA-binding domain-containing protein [Lachnospiraceae bacterium]|nr:LytTR family DNA-binding domain-containing protein [Lachnospiraceae bacterium]